MADQPISGIYAIVNLQNGKRYIGSAVNLAARWRDHKHRLIRGKHHSIILQRAWRAYGEHSFAFFVMRICPEKRLIEAEQEAINTAQPEYNICTKAGSSRGRVHTSEARAKMAAARLGSKHSAETKAKMSLARIGNQYAAKPRGPMPEWHKQKIAEALKGRVLTPEWIEKMSASKRGKPLTEQHKEKLSLSMRRYRAAQR